MGNAVELAAGSDVAVVFVGLDAGQEHESGDRNATDPLGTAIGFELPGGQQELIDKVMKANPRTVVVLLHGGPIALEYPYPPALIDAHYPGGMGGYALFDVLSGAYNPCGRLTTTVYPKDFVKRDKFDTRLRSDGGLTYMHYDGKYGEPLFEFGEGISYSNFTIKAHSPLKVNVKTSDLVTKPIALSVEVKNNAGPDGCYSALGFINSDHANAPRNRKLFDYSRANLGVGQNKVMTVSLSAETAGLVDPDGTLRVLPGTYIITVADIKFTLTLDGPAVVVAPGPPLFDMEVDSSLMEMFV